MKKNKGSLEIQDMNRYFEGSCIKIRPGLTTWKILTEDKSDNKKLIEIKDINDSNYTKYKDLIDSTCFPGDEEELKKVQKLENCIRLFPHDNDTSKFYIFIN